MFEACFITPVKCECCYEFSDSRLRLCKSSAIIGVNIIQWFKAKLMPVQRSGHCLLFPGYVFFHKLHSYDSISESVKCR